MAHPPKEIDDYISSLPQWQQANLVSFRALVREVYPIIEEGWKWSVPVFIANGSLICAMSTFKDHTKFNFFEGASLHDGQGTFNSGLDSKKHRSLNLAEGEPLPTAALKDLIAQAIAHSAQEG